MPTWARKEADTLNLLRISQHVATNLTGAAKNGKRQMGFRAISLSSTGFTVALVLLSATRAIAQVT